MSSKDGTQDKKTKKKKTTKSAEGKPKESVEEQAAKEETIKEEPEKKKEEAPAPEPEKNVEAAPEAEDKPVESAPAEEPEPTPEPAAAPQPPVEETKEGKRPSKKKEVITSSDMERLIELKEAFSLFDFNHDGIIDLQDLKYTFASLGKPDFPEEEMKKMLKEAQEPVDFDAFVALFGFKVSVLDPEEVFTAALATWDMREVGMIPEDRFKRDIRCFGDKFSGKDMDNALEEAPVYVNEGASMIDYAKFSSNICGFRNVERTRRYQKDVENAEK